ncbi:cysteine--tRNA ligase [Candidatus Parcubacteria bacterium]|uniref:Cysteine--tRNA ligase n=1 Tax=Candidatus Kaiserbacteria bacterium CG10_big_fil_rev_8_21_14_0_10_47_16 TaxID=1974608 RepID=A0A2H0UE83_9BACT|nr:cysteine--tRNA ligase [Candidatus Parcubacteria bacterium]PIR84712.1 MAG: cysteine--tRNA ligase [Candidatus Kaiserbacteria bacterium CG10_big_fil_rev_8_21_14_0_10_47_16]
MFGLFRKEKDSAQATALSLYNTASGKKEPFVPLQKGVVSMYSCGPTVYDHIHIGNLRAYLLPDITKRALQYQGFTVHHTINFTDFGHLTDDGDEGEDKMMKALKRDGKPITLAAMRDVAEIYMQSFKDDNLRFRNIPPTYYTPASDYVQEQIVLITTLMDKGYAYEISDGVYFDVTKFPEYGVLGNVDITKLKDGARVEINPEKHHPADFALWKKGMLGWDSKWGKGFPGWHIECTAMAFATLGKQIDIHTGGEDLKYTHHNGEIAQAEAITKKPFVHYWLHNAHISVNDTKIAKSLGNGIRLSGLEDRGYSPESYRYWLLTGHYRSPMNFTFEALDGARQALFRLKRYIFEEWKNESGEINHGYKVKFLTAINDDLDTPKAIALMWELVKDTTVISKDKVATLREFDIVLGLGLSDASDVAARALGVIEAEDIPDDIKKLLEERETARKNKDFAEADRLREALNLQGYTVEDSPQGARVSKV